MRVDSKISNLIFYIQHVLYILLTFFYFNIKLNNIFYNKLKIQNDNATKFNTVYFILNNYGRKKCYLHFFSYIHSLAMNCHITYIMLSFF